MLGAIQRASETSFAGVAGERKVIEFLLRQHNIERSGRYQRYLVQKHLLYISTVCLPLDDWLVGGLDFLSQQFVPLDVLEPCVLLDFLEAVVAQSFMGIPLQQSTNEVEGLLIIKVGRAYIF